MLQAHSPLGTPTRPPHYNDPNDPIVMEDPVVLDIAKKYSVHPALVSDEVAMKYCSYIGDVEFIGERGAHALIWDQ